MGYWDNINGETLSKDWVTSTTAKEQVITFNKLYPVIIQLCTQTMYRYFNKNNEEYIQDVANKIMITLKSSYNPSLDKKYYSFCQSIAKHEMYDIYVNQYSTNISILSDNKFESIDGEIEFDIQDYSQCFEDKLDDMEILILKRFKTLKSKDEERLRRFSKYQETSPKRFKVANKMLIDYLNIISMCIKYIIEFGVKDISILSMMEYAQLKLNYGDEIINKASLHYFNTISRPRAMNKKELVNALEKFDRRYIDDDFPPIIDKQHIFNYRERYKKSKLKSKDLNLF